jgi:aminoglycoside phosphotransferase (APT) family kinase protein
MEYIRGKTLLQRWPTMKRGQKIKVMQQLCELLAVMRGVFPPSGVIGSCDGSEVRDTRAKHTYFGQVCYDEEQFNEFLVSTIPYAPEYMQAAYRRNLPRNHAINFCHGDLSPDNIIVDRELNIVGLLDWEDSGWYPEYWEYVKFFARPPMVSDWHEYAPYLFPQRYKKELRDFKCMAPFRMP